MDPIPGGQLVHGFQVMAIYAPGIDILLREAHIVYRNAKGDLFDGTFENKGCSSDLGFFVEAEEAAKGP